MRTLIKLVGIIAALALIAPALHAQALVTSADLTRLETTATEIETLAATLAKTDGTRPRKSRTSR
jgi:hypothetical protein